MSNRQKPSRSACTDAELIGAYNEFLRIEQAYEAAYVVLGGRNMVSDDPAHAMLDPIPELRERIVPLRAVTAEGFLARARRAAFFFLPHHDACQDDPDSGAEDRFRATCLCLEREAAP
jgi:hypothetical protein